MKAITQFIQYYVDLYVIIFVCFYSQQQHNLTLPGWVTQPLFKFLQDFYPYTYDSWLFNDEQIYLKTGTYIEVTCITCLKNSQYHTL